MAKKKLQLEITPTLNEQAWSALRQKISADTASLQEQMKAFQQEANLGEFGSSFEDFTNGVEKLGEAGQKSGSAIKEAMADAGAAVDKLKTGFSAAGKAAAALQGALARLLIPIAIITTLVTIIKKINDARKSSEDFKKSLNAVGQEAADIANNLKLQDVDPAVQNLLKQQAEFARLRNELDEKQIANLKTIQGLYQNAVTRRKPDFEAAVLELDRRRLEVLQKITKEIAEAKRIALSEEAGRQEQQIQDQIGAIDDLKLKEAERNEDFSTALSIREKQEKDAHQKNLNRIAEERKKYIEKFGESGELSEERFNIMVEQERALSALRLANITAEENERKSLQLETAKKAAQTQAETLREELERLSDDLRGIFNLDVFGDSTLLVQGLHDIKVAIETRVNP